MSVVLRDSAPAHIPNAARLQRVDYDCAFLPARNYFSADESDIQNVLLSNGLSQNARSTQSRVAVILGYFDGQPFIGEQLQSIIKQTHSALHIYLCDDKSEPCFSLDGLQLDQDSLSKISVGVRPHNIGFTNNFLNALASISDEFEYFAFSDQDDVWHEDKLERAIAALEKAPSEQPALYCARTEIADATCEHTLGYSPLFDKPPSFANALVQNIGGGSTMVFNRAARDLILEATQHASVVSHDWWCYQVVTGAGGHVIYDSEPCLKYRQHDHNLVGANTSWRARLLRIRGLLRGRFREWNDINLAALSAHKHLLTKSNQRVLDDFVEARQSSLIKRLFLFKRSGIYRQTLFGNLGLLLGVFLNKV
ncbi:glycosyltransferase [Rhodobacteraceae bacterium XHP0102]|nr:glycosyltransferase [Rhodobacteraceae bacterium XHP0102]